MSKTFRDLLVWEKAHRMTLTVYEVTKGFPSDERFGLTAQLRRSSASVPTNIVEGFKRKGVKDQARFYNMAESSLEETKYHLILSKDLNYLSESAYADLMNKAEEVGRMLNGYLKSVIKTETVQMLS